MKKSAISFVSALLLATLPASACGPFFATPAYVYLYRFRPDVSRAIEETTDVTMPSFQPERSYLDAPTDRRQENIALWQRQTSPSISKSDIEATVYHHTYDQLHAHLQQRKPCNGFERWILRQTQRGDTAKNEYIDLLLTAKRCEENRAEMSDPWYYPYDGDDQHRALRQCLSMTQGREHSKLYNRWALQAVRLMVALGQHEQCVSYWNEARPRMTDDVISQMAEQKMAASLLQLGRRDEAAAIFARYGDIPSLYMCRERSGNRLDEMAAIYDLCPDSPYFEEELQYQLLHFDNHQLERVKRDTFYYDRDEYRREAEHAQQLLSLCRKAVSERRVKNLAMWCFAAACMSDATNRPAEALGYIRQGLAACRDPFMRNALQLLRIYDEARTASFTPQYEQHLLADLQWFDRLLVSTTDKQAVRRTFEEAVPSYHDFPNTYFYNDAMRRIVQEAIVPAALKAHRPVRALQLANYADNRLFTMARVKKCVSAWYSEEAYDYNYHDYSCDMFLLADSLSARDVEAYYLDLKRGGGDRFGRFLNARGYADRHYWADIVGTHFLREQKYHKAIGYLKTVPRSYEQAMNVAEYLPRAPFDFETWRNPQLKATREGYKLRFAREMYRLEQIIYASKDHNRRGEAMISYAIGLRNSVGHCWALTRYYDGFPREICTEEKLQQNEDAERKIARISDFLVEKGLKTIASPERKARQLHLLARNKEVVDHYRDTQTAAFLIGHCDTWRSYVAQH